MSNDETTVATDLLGKTVTVYDDAHDRPHVYVRGTVRAVFRYAIVEKGAHIGLLISSVVDPKIDKENEISRLRCISGQTEPYRRLDYVPLNYFMTVVVED
jgi:hypothetical protein